MFLKSTFFHTTSILVFILCVASWVFADTIRLKDGSVIKGKVISFSNNQFVILIGSKERQRKISFSVDEVSSVQFDSVSETIAPVSSSTKKQPKKSTYTKKKYAKTYTKKRQGGATIITVGSQPSEESSIGVSRSSVGSNLKSPSTVKNTSSNKGEISNPSSKKAPLNPVKPKYIRVPLKRIKVPADNTANGWKNTGLVARKGQKIRISANGRISLGNGRYTSPAGISTLPDPQKLIKDKPTGGLIAVIGYKNNDFIYIGAKSEFVATRDGALFLGVNEGLLNDNSGSYDVKIEVYSKLK